MQFVRPPEQNWPGLFFHSGRRVESWVVAGFSAKREREALTARERRALRCLVRGYTFGEAARSLGLHVSEVERLHASICRRLVLGGRPDLHEYAVAIGLVGRNGKD